MGWQEDKERLGKEITLALYEKGMIKTWFRDNPEGWRLVSGIWSPLYIQLRPLSSYTELLQRVGFAMTSMIKEECKDINRIIGVATAGIPISSAISLIGGIPSCYTRKLEVKSIEEFYEFIRRYGELSMIEGILENGDKIGIVDDLVTRFDSKLVAIEQLKWEVKLLGLTDVTCSDVIVLFDREQGAEKVAKEHGMRLYSLIPFASKGTGWLKDAFTSQEYEVIDDYLKNTEKYQDPGVQAELAKIAITE